MSRAWLAVADEPVDGADAQAALTTLDGAPAGHLAAWVQSAKPRREARRVDRRLVDPDGEAALISLVVLEHGRWPAFDDVAVQHARRRVLAEAPADAVSTLLADDRHFTGAVTVRRGPGAEALLRDDPFARVAPALLLRLGTGLFGAVGAPTGPTIERHGSAQPWPWDRF